MPGPEARVERKCVELAEKAGWTVDKIRFLNRRGCPDRMFSKDGRIVFIEFKAPGKEPAPHQTLVIWEMQENGLEVHVIDNVQQFRGVLDV